jgi:dissimilatory sulfite reductase (desulfoviridin) alpha/beta subunit
MAIHPDDIKRVKGLGCLQNKGTDCFNIRVLTVNGKLTAQQTKVLAEAAEKYGSGELTFTTRMTVEVKGVHYDNIDAFREYIGKAGLISGGTGPLVRPVVSCKGTTCQFGLYDTFALAEEIHNRFYLGYHSVKLPHKFKIACGGCPNNCVKPDLNDLGIVGQRLPVADLEKCRGCKVCQLEKACPVHVAHVEEGKLVIDPEICKNCGRCVGKCPFHVTDSFINGYRVYLGGRWGKNFAHGKPMEKLFASEEEVLELVEKAILLFRDKGVAGERFSDTIERIGFDYACSILESSELLDRKTEILG